MKLSKSTTLNCRNAARFIYREYKCNLNNHSKYNTNRSIYFIQVDFFLDASIDRERQERWKTLECTTGFEFTGRTKAKGKEGNKIHGPKPLTNPQVFTSLPPLNCHTWVLVIDSSKP